MPITTHKYSNKDITIIWQPDICIHSKICWQGLHNVFDPTRRPWILPEAADTATIMAQIDKCPSGALSYIKNTATETPATPEPPAAGVTNMIECLPNGPLLVKGEIIVKNLMAQKKSKPAL